MQLMNEKLEQAYLNPNGKLFIFFSKLHQKTNLFILIIALLLLCYPIIKVANNILTEIELEKVISEKRNDFENKNQQYQTLIAKEKDLNEKEYNLTYLNQSIQEIAQKSGVKIQHIQWQLEQGKSMDISVINQSSNLLVFIQQLNQMPYLKFNNLILTKSEQARNVEMNATLVLTKNKE